MQDEAQIYASEMMLQNYKRSGRLCAFIKSTGQIWKLKVGYTDICGLLSFPAVLDTGNVEQSQCC